MPIEIEKKYRLTAAERRAIEKRLREIGSQPKPLEHEENTIYRGGNLGFGVRALRLRRVKGEAILTFKERIPTKSPIKHQMENETRVHNADATDAILRGIGFVPALVYEKRRTRWDVGNAMVVIDELPYGLFMEIEASEKDIKRVEKMIAAQNLPAVTETYPAMTAKNGKKNRKGIIEARFKSGVRNQKPEIRNQTSDIRSQKSEIRNQKSHIKRRK
jgi:adenylate cyclase class 2